MIEAEEQQPCKTDFYSELPKVVRIQLQKSWVVANYNDFDVASFHQSKFWLGAVARAWNSCALGGQGGWIHLRSGVWDQTGQHGKTPSLLKIQKFAGLGGMPVVPATQEAEAGESLEPRRRRLQWAEIMPLHSSLGDTVRLCPHFSKIKTFRCSQQWRNLNRFDFDRGILIIIQDSKTQEEPI